MKVYFNNEETCSNFNADFNNIVFNKYKSFKKLCKKRKR